MCVARQSIVNEGKANQANGLFVSTDDDDDDLIHQNLWDLVN